MRRRLAIEAIGPGGFRIDGVWRPASLLILDDEAHAWRPAGLADVRADDLGLVWQAAPGDVEFVLLGTGPAQALPPRAVCEALAARGIGLEFMATEAAARTHNVLASQGRRFATALIPI